MQTGGRRSEGADRQDRYLIHRSERPSITNQKTSLLEFSAESEVAIGPCFVPVGIPWFAAPGRKEINHSAWLDHSPDLIQRSLGVWDMFQNPNGPEVFEFVVLEGIAVAVPATNGLW